MHVELKGVTKSFQGIRALDGISLEIASGERVALIGPNGSGKSTLVRAVMGLVHCQGTVRLGGGDPREHGTRLTTHIAYVPQAAAQLGATVGELVRAIATLRAIAIAAIRATATELKLDLDLVWHRPVRALSRGTKQKLLIALALAVPVSLLIMDEPTASLDGDAREAFFHLFETRARGATLLLSSHHLDEVQRLVQRVVALENGRVVSDVPVTAPAVAQRLNGAAVWLDSSGDPATAWSREAS